ncbi:MAG: polysaccharide deacetylase family protein [Anaerolineae bacterium]|nr:polysaccharide deacetylase family protein [Anaerolineae bacterium]
MNKIACLTLDVEADHHDLVAPRLFTQVLNDGETWAWLAHLSASQGVPITAFVVGELLETQAGLAARLKETCAEVGLHSFSHRPATADSLEEIRRGKAAFRAAFGHDPAGYRAPLGLITKRGWERLRAEGFAYDSSIYPSVRPGRFNGLVRPTEPWCVAGDPSLVELPLATLPRLRLILSASYVKLLGTGAYRALLAIGGLPDVAVIDCHLHDLAFAAEAHPLLPARWRLIYGHNRSGGRAALTWIADTLRARGYTFCTMAQAAATVCANAAKRGSHA